jgi:hypothetical protein
MASHERRRSIGSLFGQANKDSNSLAAPRATSKGPGSSAVSVASSDGNEDLGKTGDGAMDRFRSRQNSEDARSDTSTSHRRRMSKFFKGRSRRRGSDSQEDLSQADPNETVPPVPDVRRPSMGHHPLQSEESLGLAKSVASSLLTDDSDPEA